MASDVVVFQIQTFLNSLEELTPNLPLTLSTEFDQIKKCIEGANLVNKHVWPYSAAPASSSLLPLLNDLNDLLAECSVYAEQSQNVSEGLSNCHYNAFQTFSVRKMKQKLKSKKDKLAEKITELGISSSPSMGMALFPTSRYTSFESKPDFQLIGFDEEEKKIEGLISDNSYKAIGVYGMAGSGKTALLLKVLNSPTIQNQFSPIIWLCLSDIHSQDQEDPEHFELSIVKFILCELGCDVDKWTNTNPSKAYLLEHLKNLLMSKKYLIVFDDVWEDNEFYANLGAALPVSDDIVKSRLSEALPRDGGGKIIMTSRQKEVGKKMAGEKNLICMKPLSRESCRMILENEIGLTGCVKKIEGWLNGSGFVSIGIYGPSCSANMAVVRKVLSNPSVRGKFQHIIWVPVSVIFLNHHQIHPGDEIMKRTLKELGCDDELTKNKSGLNLREIVNQSLRSKKYMIVLSDVVYDNNNFWRLISSAWPKDGDGTILVTSKTKELTEYLVGENLVHVRLPTKSKSDEGGDVIAIDHQCCGVPYPAKMMFEYEILEYAKEIEGWLINGSEHVSIGIYGLSSSANTAVARMVLRSPSVRETFEPIIWVPVSLIFLNYDQINAWSEPWKGGDEVWREFMKAGDEIAKRVLKELGYDDELTNNKTGHELMEMVRESLGSKKYLVVLDDVVHYNPDFWGLISSLWPRDGGGAVIETSKAEALVRYADHLVHVRLPELESNETSDVVIDGNYISDDIVDQCGGLPFAAKTLANIILEK